MFIKNMDLQGRLVLHLAPERGLYEAIRALGPAAYHVADFDPRRYANIPGVVRLDLCDLDALPSNHYDLIIHSHVLEHVPCNIAYPLYHLHRALTPDGLHVCIIPFMTGQYDESFAEIGAEERCRRFGQFDHVRRFGRDDIARHLGSILDLTGHQDASVFFSPEELQAANIPVSSGRGFTIDTVLRLHKTDMKFLR
jgi:phosphoglycolate phosphatase